MLFRWFVGLSPYDPIWRFTKYTKNRERFLIEQLIRRFLAKLMGAQEVKLRLNDEHFSVGGTLPQAWESHASLQQIDGKDDPSPPPSGPGEAFGAPMPGSRRAKVVFCGIMLSNEIHRSGTDPDSLLRR